MHAFDFSCVKGGELRVRCAVTGNSGPARHMYVEEDGGYISSGSLEMSNVDLSAEFTDMIVTQRGFQANSRVITVSDTLLDELRQLKR